MGHWSEDLVDDLARMVGGNPDRALLKDLLAKAENQVEALAGRSFHPLRRSKSSFEPNGLPLVDAPDMRVGTMEFATEVWAVPDPVNPEIAPVLQISPAGNPARRAEPVAKALWTGGLVVARASRAGLLSGDYVLRWLGALKEQQRLGVLRRVMSPEVRFSIPIVGMQAGGWWIQIARRLIWLTSQTQDEGRLGELLLESPLPNGDVVPLIAAEPVLIVARMTRQPVDWALSARIWAEPVRLPVDRPWSMLAKAVHGAGIPTITLDRTSTPFEVACQLVLKAYWHGYIDRDDPVLAHAVGAAYPKEVERIQRGTRGPSKMYAAATLLEQLVSPGFDPAQGAELTRRYVRRKASIAIMEFRKAEAPVPHVWTEVGISERRYYKLLPLFAQKVSGRYEYDRDEVIARMKEYLNQGERDREIRAAALALLRSRGFRDDAARKWLQRHSPIDAVKARPRGS
jgi:hypothetical protein